MEKFFIKSFEAWKEVSNTVYQFSGVEWREGVKKIVPHDSHSLVLDTDKMFVEFQSDDCCLKFKIENLILENGFRVEAP